MELDDLFNYVDYEEAEDKFEMGFDDDQNLVVNTDLLGVQDIYLRIELN